VGILGYHAASLDSTLVSWKRLGPSAPSRLPLGSFCFEEGKV